MVRSRASSAGQVGIWTECSAGEDQDSSRTELGAGVGTIDCHYLVQPICL